MMIYKPGAFNAIRLTNHCRELWKGDFILPDVVLGKRDWIEIIVLICNPESLLSG